MRRDEHVEAAGTGEQACAESRREALRRIGLYGAVGGPLLLGLLRSEKAVAQTIP